MKHISMDLNTTVLEIPHFAIFPLHVNAKEGTNISVTCKLTNPVKSNTPLSDLTWCVNGKEYTGIILCYCRVKLF